MIEVKHLTKKYGNHIAVNDLSFQVEEGQIYGFLGPNGAGKSTTMNIITGYIASTEGTVVINGHDILEEPEEAKRSIGYLPEQPPLYMDMTVHEYLKLAAELKKVAKEKRETMIEDIMNMVQITPMKDRLIKNLSKGYKQRVGLAQALMGYPEVIILDEPTVGLDPKQIIEIRDLIKSLSKKHTVILSSHILSEVSAVCDYIMIISHGKLVASDTPENLEKLMRGENTLEITLKGTEGQARKILSEIEAEDQQIKADKAEGTVELSLKIPGGTDPREEIFYACVKENCPILKMETKHVSLEDIFLELTSQDASAVVSQKGKKEPEEEKEPEGAVESIEEAAEASGMFATSEETVTEEEQDHEDNL
ncbi:MAG TPA: ABC transporter ATP-binding protein [Candidatus Limivivens merdigallinarum]|uniref:ABC transporter ATP-binding protein n=1 Tax=Candidatus Limivivens merdigallinarum TaxID=2840859 RepID=A0A9D0ZYM4_9FIRM|nr:ABC transporter ATP-binding protein [Candidatus Limivivens merdigallinarum]